MTVTFRQLLDQFETSARSRRDQGDRFEDFVAKFLVTDPLWAERVGRVWKWSDWPGRSGRPDTGIDLVVEEAGTGELVAVQCKFYSPSAVLDWGHVSTFVGMTAQPDFSSGLIVSTAGSESANLHRNLEHHSKPINVWRVEDFEQSPMDWSVFRIDYPTVLKLLDVKQLRPHQRRAIDHVTTGFTSHDRGQMIMACGTGKTLTSLRLAEELVGPGGSVLFMVPSINLLSQTVKAWAADATTDLATFAVCSDIHAGRRTDDDMSPNDLSFPASTSPARLMASMAARCSPQRMTVVFSTYQSVDVIGAAQREHGLGPFDLIICDEAHRTTGAFREVDDEAAFTKIHRDTNVVGKRRLYMTATPKVYGDQTRALARQADVVLASMDDEATFGPVFHELPFGTAVADGLLTDYKVLVLAVNEDAVSAAFQHQLSRDGNELNLDDVARIVGCWHGLSKRGPQFDDDQVPMRRAVAFSSKIVNSKRFAAAFPHIVNAAMADRKHPNAVAVEARHVDGTTNVKDRDQAISWLEEPPGQRVCRVLSNAKVLTEGVDVPALDAVLFLNPRKSIVDVVQAVGRVMRLAPDKEYGYVILPVAIPATTPPEEALRNNDRYKVVWQVLQALRSHDERLAAEINKIDINRASSKVAVIGIGVAGGDEPDGPGVTTTSNGATGSMQLTIPGLAEWRDAIYARIVEKVGDRQYMEHWARDIQQIAAAQESRIRALLAHPDTNPAAVERFEQFHTALQHNLNDSISRDDAIGMLSQHLITRPVFEALFGSGEFTERNPVSRVMQQMVDVLDDHNLDTETATLQGFYEHVRMLIGGITTAEGRQDVIKNLYEKFFKRALPRQAESLGIVYTPIEVVDFINRSVNDLLARHFDGASLSDEGVHILDPFTGTGTFITRMMHTGLITPDALGRKYRGELHANELMLLAYYVAAINIETTFQALNDGVYEPFDGIVLTDTFQMSEPGDPMDTVYFPTNNARADRQKELDIRVIVGNPPYSVGQTSQNDNNANLTYPDLDRSIAATYAARTDATNKNKLYDSYIRAIRWASNRIAAAPDGGVVGFVTNGGWLDSNSTDGIRLSLADEFHHVYVYNLRGNQRTSGEQSRREGGKIFGSGSRNTVAITLLIKLPTPLPADGAEIHYVDIGDYLDRDVKLARVAEATIDTLPWTAVAPNEHGDWLNARSTNYADLITLAGSDDAIFGLSSNGAKTNRDPWAYNSSEKELRTNVERMIDFYNQQVDAFHAQLAGARPTTDLAKAFVDRDPTRFSWDDGDFTRMVAGRRYELTDEMIRTSLYRPFTKQSLAFDRTLNSRAYQLPRMFPAPDSATVGIAVVQNGSRSPFGAVATDTIPCLHLIGSDATTFYPRWRYQAESDTAASLFDTVSSPGHVSNINPAALSRFRAVLGDDVTDDDVFFYVYGVLHSPAFRETFETNLKREKPRVPFPANRDQFDAFAAAGHELCELHVSYETVDPYPLDEEWSPGSDPATNPDVLRVGTSKMKWATSGGARDLTRLVVNPHLTLTGIPDVAHRYVIGTRSGLEWLIDRYYIKTDTASGIVNDPNLWGDEHSDPWYIVNLIKRVVTVSIRTVEIVDSLPNLDLTGTSAE